MLERMDMENEQNKTKEYSFWKKILYVITNARFITSLLTITFIYLISSGLQYWITDYAINVVKVSKESAFSMFIICGAIGPILGVGLSGFIFDKFGGYTGMRTPVLVIIF